MKWACLTVNVCRHKSYPRMRDGVVRCSGGFGPSASCIVPGNEPQALVAGRARRRLSGRLGELMCALGGWVGGGWVDGRDGGVAKSEGERRERQWGSSGDVSELMLKPRGPQVLTRLAPQYMVTWQPFAPNTPMKPWRSDFSNHPPTHPPSSCTVLVLVLVLGDLPIRQFLMWGS